MGRMPKEEFVPDEPTTAELNNEVNRDSWVWVEGRVYVQGQDQKIRTQVDIARTSLAKFGLVLHEQDGLANAEDAPLYRKWSGKRIPLEEASAALMDFPSGITIEQFAEELYQEPGWTEQHRKAAIRKTYVVINKLKSQGLLAKRKGLLFTTQTTKPIPPVMVALVKSHLGEACEGWTMRMMSGFIRELVAGAKACGIA